MLSNEEVIDVTTVTETREKVICDCGYKMSVLSPAKTWRKLLCVCGTIWWVKPSGRRFEKHTEHVDFDY